MQRLLLLIPLLLMGFLSFAQNGKTKVQYTVKNASSLGGQSQGIYDAPSSTANIITSISPQIALRVSEISFGSGAMWGKVDLPSENASAIGYIMLDCNSQMISDISLNWIVILSNQLTIYSSNTTTSVPVVINGSDAKVFASQAFVVKQIQGNWYKIDLPNNCNQNYGWIQGTSTELTSNTPGAGANLPSVPSLTNSISGNSSISLTVGTANTDTIKAVNCINYNVYAKSQTTPNSLTMNGLSGGTIYTIKLIAFNTFGYSCASPCTTLYTLGNIIPTASFSPSDLTVLPNQAIDFNNLSTNATTYSWNFGDNTTSNLTSPSKSYSTIGSKSVTLTATSPTGHTSSYNLSVNVVSSLPVPNTIQIDNLIFSANSISSGNIKTATGNVSVSIVGCGTALKFGGNVSLNMADKRITGNCNIFAPNVQGVDKDLYSGNFDIGVKNDSLNFLVNGMVNVMANMQMSFSGITAKINKLNIICDGIGMRADILLPKPITGTRTRKLMESLDSIKIQTAGITIADQMRLNEAMINQITPLDSTTLNYNGGVNTFNGYSQLKIPIQNIRFAQSITINASPEALFDCLHAPSSFLYKSIIGQPISNTGLILSKFNNCNIVKTNNYSIYNVLYDLNLVTVDSNNFKPLLRTNIRYLGDWKFNINNPPTMLGTAFFSLGGFGISNFNNGMRLTIDKNGNGNFDNGVFTFDFIKGDNLKFTTNPKRNFNIFSPTFWKFSKINISGEFKAITTVPNDNFIGNIRPKCARKALRELSEGDILSSSDHIIRTKSITGAAKVKIKDDKYKLFSYEYRNRDDSGWGWKFRKNMRALPLSMRGGEGYSPISLQQQRTTANNPNGIHFFTIGNCTSNFTVEAIGNNGIPELVLYTPWGDSLTYNNAINYEGAIFMHDTTENLASIWWENPKLGDYMIKVIGADTLEMFDENVAPSIRIQSVVANPTAGLITITWEDNDPDDDALITLFLDKDMEGIDGIIIVDSLHENSSTNSYTFNYSNFPSGNYYVGAMIEDTLEQLSYNYFSSTSYTINGTNLPPAPTFNSIIMAGDTAVQGIMTRNSSQHLTYLLYYSPTTPVDYNSPSLLIPDADTFNVAHIIPHGRTYYFKITAIDAQNRESQMSNQQTLSYVSNVNNAPYFATNQNFNSIAKVGQQYSYQLSVTDIDNNPLSFSMLNSIPAFSVSNTGLITGLPTNASRGIHRMYIKVNDPDGAADSIAFNLYVRDSVAYKPEISFDKNTFFDTNDFGVISIEDESFTANTASTASYTARDTISFRLYSKSDPIGINMKARESTPNSRIFVTDFRTGTTTNIATRRLKVATNDTIWAKYTSNGVTIKKIAFVTTFLAKFKTDTVVTDTAFFGNLSKGYNLHYSWNFGDGIVDSVKHPYHKYISNGTYYVFLQVTDAKGHSGIYRDTITINVQPPLPVTWLGFVGEVMTEGNMLNWQTTNEINNHHFVVERSNNNLDFTDLGMVEADMKNITTHTYSFNDKEPLFGNQYYRLRQVDIDGNISYSKTIELYRSIDQYTILLFPNPIKEILHFNLLSASNEEVSWALVNEMGITAKKGFFTTNIGKNIQDILLDDITSGAYVFRVNIGGKLYTQKLIKN